MSTERHTHECLGRRLRRHTFTLLVATSLVGGCGGESAEKPSPQAAVAPSPSASSTTTKANQAPVLKGSMPSQVLVGQALAFAPEASDPDGDRLTFAANGLPGWMTIEPSTGRISGKPGAGDVGTYAGIVISVSDGQNTTALPAQTVAVVATASGKATLSWVPPTENVDGTPITNLAGYRIRYGTSPDSLNQTVDIANAGVASYVIQDLTPATWYFVVTAYTKAGVESDLSNLASKTITG